MYVFVCVRLRVSIIITIMIEIILKALMILVKMIIE